MQTSQMPLREIAETIFRRTMDGIRVERYASQRIFVDLEQIYLGEFAYARSRFTRCVLVAIGKAAVPMARCVTAAVESVFQRGVGGIVVAPNALGVPDGLTYYRGAHPLPEESSFVAAHAALELLETVDDETLVVFLISGGASAMMELPLDEDVSLQDTRAFHRLLVHSGLPIEKMNVIRKHFSQVKGGRLAEAAAKASQICTLLISDVPANRLDTVGSGPSMADPSSVKDCRRILTEARLWHELPESVRIFFRRDDLPETPKQLLQSDACALLSSETMSAIAASVAKEMGFEATVDDLCDEWTSSAAAEYLVQRMQQMAGRNICLISVGEVSVAVSEGAGMGGRNQHFTLEAAKLIAGRADTAVLSAGSDGIDGNTGAAGAVVDESSWDRATTLQLRPQQALDKFDSHTVLDRLGATLLTGPTGNNVRDLRLFLCRRA